MRRLIGASEGSGMYMLSLAAASILSVILSFALSRSTATIDGMSLYGWIGYVLMQAAFIAVVFIYSKVRKVDVLYVARFRKPVDLRQLILTPFIAIATILVFLPFANLWGEFLTAIGFKGGVMTPKYSNFGFYFLALILMAALPAFGEETLMRGCLFSGLSTRNIWFGILMSAGFFSLMHQNPLQTVHQFGLGVVLAIVVALTDSILPAALIHFFNNFISITCAAYIPQIDAAIESLGYFNILTGAVSVVVGVVLLLVLFFILFKLGAKGYTVTSGSIEYDDFSIYADIDDSPKNPVKEFLIFFKSLFTKSGWRKVTNTLASRNGVQYVGKAQSMIGVWLAIGLSGIYWLFSFVSGLI